MSKISTRPASPSKVYVRPQVASSDGPWFRFFQGGLEYTTKPRKPHALFIDAMEPEGSWIYVLRGAIHYEVGNTRHRIAAGQALVTRKPSPGWLIRARDDLPIYYVWVHVTGELALKIFDYAHLKYGQIQSLPMNCEAVRLGKQLITLAAGKKEYTAAFWSEKTFLWLNAWLRCAEKQYGPVPRILLEVGKPSRLFSFGPKNIKTFAAEIGYSRSHLTRKLRVQWGESPGRVLRSVRLEEAARLLRTTRLSVQAIALKIGYSTTASFSRAFSAKWSLSPLAYRHTHPL